MHTRNLVLTGLVVAGLVIPGACSNSTSSGNEQPYDEQMAAICNTTEQELSSLPAPPAEISLTDFATEVAGILSAEADAARNVDPPDELAADHRAFIANTDDQRAAWTNIADTAATDPDGITEERNHLDQLTLGRDDLASQMGLDECRRAA